LTDDQVRPFMARAVRLGAGTPPSTDEPSAVSCSHTGMAARNAARQSPTFSGYRIFSRSHITCSTRFRSASNSSGVLVGGTWINGKIVRSTLENGFGIANPSHDFSLQKELNSKTSGIN